MLTPRRLQSWRRSGERAATTRAGYMPHRYLIWCVLKLKLMVARFKGSAAARARTALLRRLDRRAAAARLLRSAHVAAAHREVNLVARRLLANLGDESLLVERHRSI